jgi:secondary thiamine-phosphate synthase enzyme
MKIETKGTFTDITDLINEELFHDSGNPATVLVFSRHTTAGIAILENEKLLKADYEHFLNRLAPDNGFYAHNMIDLRDVPPDERRNGDAHIKALFFQPSMLIPVDLTGNLDLGKWQRVFLVDLDAPREREIIVRLI